MRLTNRSTTMTRRRKAKSPEYAVSDEAAAYIADVLMELALQFEATHFSQIRRHYQSIMPAPSTVSRQLDLFEKHPDRNRRKRNTSQSDPRLLHPPPGPFFGSTRAASILPSRPPNLAAAARRACQGWPRLRGHPLGLGLDWPEHGGKLDWSGCRHLDGDAADSLARLLPPHVTCRW